jgi:predicted phage tail protein
MNTMLRTIRLYGVLGSKFGRVHRMAVNSAAEAIHALGIMLPGFDAFLTQSKDNGLAYAVFYGKTNISKDELLNACKSEIRIAPIVMGSKNGGVFNIILGAVLVIVGMWITGLSFGAAAPIGGALMSMGWGMIVGGLVQLLTPVPRGQSAQDKPDNQPSYAFNGPINTQAQGNPVPVLYGELIVGSAVISAAINTVDQAYIPTGIGGAGSGGGGGGGSAPWHQDWLAIIGEG